MYIKFSPHKQFSMFFSCFYTVFINVNQPSSLFFIFHSGNFIYFLFRGDTLLSQKNFRMNFDYINHCRLSVPCRYPAIGQLSVHVSICCCWQLTGVDNQNETQRFILFSEVCYHGKQKKISIMNNNTWNEYDNSNILHLMSNILIINE